MQLTGGFMKFETKFQEIISRTHDVTSFRFPRPRGLEYKPGQFFFMTIKQGDKELSKHFSFSSSPTEMNHIEFTKKFTDHEFSMALKAVKVGDWARIDAPYGQFTFEGEYPKIALLGGGIGITPFMSICKNAADKGLNNKITLFYGCRTENDIVFKKEFEEIAQKNKNMKIVFTVNEATAQWKGATGIINAEMIKRELPDYKENVFYACGPPPMVKAMEMLIERVGLPKNQLKLEYFTGYP
jgi:ferredoxin-NADP reductase